MSSDASPQKKCVFWRPEESEIWNTSGCRRLPSESDADITTCECDHLTIFAALMDPYGPTVSQLHVQPTYAAVSFARSFSYNFDVERAFSVFTSSKVGYVVRMTGTARQGN